MGDNYWMKDELRGEWGKASKGNSRNHKPNKPTQNNKSFDISFQIKDFILQNNQFTLTETGSQFLDPVLRHNIIEINNNLIKIEALISLN